MPVTGSQPGDAQDSTSDGLTKHHCTCRRATVLGAYGLVQGTYCYKIIWRDRAMIVYFGAFTVKCKDCGRWCRVRMLPKESRVEINSLRSGPEDGEGTT